MKRLQLKPNHAAILAMAWMLLIIYLSNQPGIPLDPEAPPSPFQLLPDLLTNLLHIPEYGILATLIWFSIRHRFSSAAKASLVVILSVLLFAISDELHQSFVPGRFASVQDIVSDFLGGGLALLLLVRLDPHHGKLVSD